MADELNGAATPEPDQVPAHLTATAQEKERIVLLLGNVNPQMQVPVHAEDPETGQLVRVGQRREPAKHLDQSVTRVEVEPGIDDPDWVAHTLSTDNDRVLTLIARWLPDEHKRYAVVISQVEQIMREHADGVKPAWVDGNDTGCAKAIAAFYGCPLGQPTALLTNGGRDALHAQHMSASAQPASFNYMAVSANAATELATNTTLPGEITTAGGGLLRAQGTYAHTVGTNTTTITKTCTANSSDSLPVTLAKIGVLNASSAGTLGYEKLLNAPAPLNVTGDNVTVTWTDTVG